MQVDDREQLAAVWLVDGPGPEALWPLDGRYAEHRGERYFPKGTRVDAHRVPGEPDTRKARAAAGLPGDAGVDAAVGSHQTVSLDTRKASRGAS